jgi:hypothetical protein
MFPILSSFSQVAHNFMKQCSCYVTLSLLFSFIFSFIFIFFCRRALSYFSPSQVHIFPYIDPCIWQLYYSHPLGQHTYKQRTDLISILPLPILHPVVVADWHIGQR